MNDPDIDRLIRDLLDLDKRDKAALEIAEFGPAARAAVPNLIAALSFEPDDYCINPFVIALGAIGPEAKDALPALTEALDHAREDEDWLTCAQVAEAIWSITLDEGVRKTFYARKVLPHAAGLIPQGRRYG